MDEISVAKVWKRKEKCVKEGELSVYVKRRKEFWNSKWPLYLEVR